MFHLLWLPRPGRPLDCRPGKPPPPPSPSSRISRFLDFKISRESSSTRDRATDPKELSTRTDLSSADLEILTASQDFPADSALQHKCFDHQQWCIWLHALHSAQVHQLCTAQVLWWPTGLVSGVHHCNWAPSQHRWWWEKLSINTRPHVNILRNAPKIDGTQDYEMLLTSERIFWPMRRFYTCLTKTKLAERGLLLVGFPTRLSSRE